MGGPYESEKVPKPAVDIIVHQVTRALSMWNKVFDTRHNPWVCSSQRIASEEKCLRIAEKWYNVKGVPMGRCGPHSFSKKELEGDAVEGIFEITMQEAIVLEIHES